MDSIEQKRIEHRVRLHYEWGRLRRACLGFTPAIAIVSFAVMASKRPASALAFGSMLFVAGAALLWYGRELKRAVLPGVLAGLTPLALSLCANRLGHVCTGERCLMLCVPACMVGGLAAGLALAALGYRRRYGLGFWMGASTLALLTGAMGCACVGYSGVAGLGMGYAAGLAPTLIQALFTRRPF